MNADHMVAIHNALHSPSRVARIGRDTLVVELVDEIHELFKRIVYGNFVFASQNLRKDSPNTRWILESPESRQISWMFPKGRSGFSGKIASHQDNGFIHLEVLRFYPGNKTHKLIDQTYEVG